MRMGLNTVGLRCLAAGAVLALATAWLAVPGEAKVADLPNPCTLVPVKLVQTALGLKKPPVGTYTQVLQTSTCVYNGLLSTSVGYQALTNPAIPLKATPVAGLPGGTYTTYSGSTQTQVAFHTGTAATGLYGVIRNFAKVKKTQLIKIAKLVYAGSGGASASGSSTHLVTTTNG